MKTRATVVALALTLLIPTAAVAQTARTAATAKIGWSWNLAGSGGLRMKVTVLGVNSNVQGGEYDEPRSGYKFVGVRVRLKNIGHVRYSDSPSNGAQLITGGGETGRSTIISADDCDSEWSSQSVLLPGGSSSGCIPFEIKKGATPKWFYFTLDSGFADQTGRWLLRR